MTDQDATRQDSKNTEVNGDTQPSAQNEVTRVYGRRNCPTCHCDNQAKNEFCFHCGAPLGNVPEVVQRASLTERTRANWRVYGIETTTVGREAELTELTDQFRKVVEEGQFAAVLVVGPDGIGKSRLIDTFGQRINTAFGNALMVAGAWYEGSEANYAIVDQIVRSRLYIPHTLPEQEARQRLVEGIRAIVKEPTALEIAHRIGRLIGLTFPDDAFSSEESPDSNRIAAWRAVVDLIKADAESNPLVLVMEDMQFAREQSLDFMAFVAREVRNCPVMYIVSSTEETPRLLVDPLKQLPNLREIRLKALADEQIRQLVNQVLSRAEGIPPVVYQRVCTNSLGNPLIAEEILRILMAEGAIDILGPRWRIHPDKIAVIQIPSGLVDVVHASLARLKPEDRQLIEDAAVVGDVFWRGPLLLVQTNLHASPPDAEFPWRETDRIESRLGKLLKRLVDLDLVLQRDVSQYPDDMEYVFKHAAVRRLLLEDVDGQRLKQVHSLVAQWYELNRSRGIPVRDATIAFHHEMAGNLERAGLAYLEAARKSRANHHNRQAVEQYQKVLALLDDSYVLERIEALHGIGSVYDLTGEYERALEPLYQMLNHAWMAASLSKSGAAHDKLGRAYRSLGDLDKANAHFEQALILFRRANDKVGLASAIDDMGMVHVIRGDYPSAVKMFEEALNRRRELGDKKNMALSYNHLGSVNLYQGNVKEALIHLREALTLRKEAGDKRGVAQSLNNLGVVLAERGNLEDALRLWQESVQVAMEIGDHSLQCALFSNMGEVAGMLGRLDEASIHLERASRLCQDHAERRISFDVTRNQAILDLKRGNSASAHQLAQTAIEMAKGLDSPVMEGIALRCMAEIQAHDLLGEGAEKLLTEEVDQVFRTAIELLEGVGNDVELGRTLYSRGVFLAEQGQPEEAVAALSRAEKLFFRLGMKLLLDKTKAVMAEIAE